jgi:hypothetical protein
MLFILPKAGVLKWGGKYYYAPRLNYGLAVDYDTIFDIILTINLYSTGNIAKTYQYRKVSTTTETFTVLKASVLVSDTFKFLRALLSGEFGG